VRARLLSGPGTLHLCPRKAPSPTDQAPPARPVPPGVGQRCGCSQAPGQGAITRAIHQVKTWSVHSRHAIYGHTLIAHGLRSSPGASGRANTAGMIVIFVNGLRAPVCAWRGLGDGMVDAVPHAAPRLVQPTC
jgi:hypothetical protein